MSMHAQSILLNILEKVYYSHKYTLQDYINEYYSESAQLINLGFYEMKRRPKKATVTSKVHRDEHHSELSHTQLKDARRTRKPETAASELTETSLRGSRILLSTPLNHLADSETRPLSHSSLTMAQRNVERSSSEPHAITPEERKPSVEAITHREQKSRTAPSNQSDRNRTIAQMSKNLDSLESRFNSHKNLSQRTSTRATDVESSPPSHCTLTRVHAETDRDNPKSDCQRLTWDGLKPSHHTNLESTKTHRIMRARGDTASTLSRAKLSKNLDVVPEPRRIESENVPPTPRGRVDDDCLSPHVWKPPDKSSTKPQASWIVNSNVDITSVNKHSPLKPEAQTVPPCSSRSLQRLQESSATNSSIDSPGVPQFEYPPSKFEVQTVPLSRTRNLQGFPNSYPEVEWRAHGETRTPCARKPPDKEDSELHGSYIVNNNVDPRSVEKHSPYKAHVPIRSTRSLKELLTSYREPLQRAHSTEPCPGPLSARKLPDKETSKFHGSYAVNHDVDSTSAKKHSLSKPEAPIVPPQLTRSSLELPESYQELERRAQDKQSMPRMQKPPDKGIKQLQESYVVNSSIDSMSIKRHSPLISEARTVPLRPTRSLQELLDSHTELPWRAPNQSQPPHLQHARKPPPDKHLDSEFLLGTLERAKGGLRSVSKLLWPAFDSVRCRQARLAPCLEPNG
ncbi:hypothetical protein M378DRAFT_18680 [Amanita muscaria Koide BX008]|uniref:Uncharacterized protein n=1 Tax=Amanita muscaria (strain Koide BX008) TaxID=946122 RepID=A0A0C2WDK3_AMAMK|nr:hypothetical protein M378DRAFT_18680 [Amanita muscaria Koide BX008]